MLQSEIKPIRKPPGKLRLVTIDYPKAQRKLDAQTPELAPGTRVFAICYERPNKTRKFYYQAFLRIEAAKKRFSELKPQFNQNSLEFYFVPVPLIVNDFSVLKKVF